MEHSPFWSQQSIRDALASSESAKQCVEVDPDIMDGVPVIAGTRIPVYVVLELFEASHSIEQIVQDYPSLTCEKVKGALEFASLVMTIR